MGLLSCLPAMGVQYQALPPNDTTPKHSVRMSASWCRMLGFFTLSLGFLLLGFHLGKISSSSV